MSANPTIRSVVASDGVRLHFRHWCAPAQPAGVVICLHGIQSHSAWYEYSSGYIAAAGFHVYFADRRGSGLNGRQRGHADHGLRLLNDVAQLIRLARRECPEVPLTLLGLSWGGKIAAAFAFARPGELDRLILLSPGLSPRLRPNFWQSWKLRFARSHDLRHKPAQLPLQDAALFTDDEKWQAWIADDPLALHFVTSGLLNSGRDLDRIVSQTKVTRLPPTLLLLAGRDQIIDNALTRHLVSSWPTNNLTIREYSAAQHTLEFDSKREVIFRDLTDWLCSTATE